MTTMLGEPSQPTADATPSTVAFVGVELAPLDTLPAQYRAVSSAIPADVSGIQPGDVVVAIDACSKQCRYRE